MTSNFSNPDSVHAILFCYSQHYASTRLSLARELLRMGLFIAGKSHDNIRVYQYTGTFKIICTTTTGTVIGISYDPTYYH
jgi:hypothetical protein